MNLNDEQSLMLDALRETHAELALKRSTLRAQVEKELENLLNAVLRRRSRQANQCVRAGISKTKIGRAMGTSDWKTISAILAVTADEFEDQQAPPAATFRLAGLDEQGSPSAIVFDTYTDRATGRPAEGPLRVPLRKMGGGPFVTFDDTAESNQIINSQLYEAVQGINKGFETQPAQPEVAQQKSDDYKARFFVPDDEEDED